MLNCINYPIIFCRCAKRENNHTSTFDNQPPTLHHPNDDTTGGEPNEIGAVGGTATPAENFARLESFSGAYDDIITFLIILLS